MKNLKINFIINTLNLSHKSNTTTNDTSPALQPIALTNNPHSYHSVTQNLSLTHGNASDIGIGGVLSHKQNQTWQALSTPLIALDFNDSETWITHPTQISHKFFRHSDSLRNKHHAERNS